MGHNGFKDLCGESLQENDDDEEEKFEPKTQTENASDGGGRSNRPTRIGASTPDDSDKRRQIRASHRPQKQQPSGQSNPADGPPASFPKSVELKENADSCITVKELAQQLGESDVAVIKQLFMIGFPRTVSQAIDLDLARTCAISMGYIIDDQKESS